MSTAPFQRAVPAIRSILVLAALLFAFSPLQAQERTGEFPRDALDEELDELATERAQELNAAYYDYERQLEDVRMEADRRDAPEYYTDRRQELRSDLESEVLRIERRYEEIRADLLQEHTGRRFEGEAVENRFDLSAERPAMSGIERNARMAQLNDELASAWAEFNREADAARERARQNDDWDRYEETITRLESEYQQTIADIQARQRALRFELSRERRDAADSPQTTP